MSYYDDMESIRGITPEERRRAEIAAWSKKWLSDLRASVTAEREAWQREWAQRFHTPTVHGVE